MIAKTTHKPWFGPKRFGIGFRPIAWQGWVLTFGLPLIVLIIIIGLNGNLT